MPPTTTTKRTRKPGKGCRGAKAVRGVDRGAAMVLMRKRRKLCRACTQKSDCYVAHQEGCSQRRILSDPKKSCPGDPSCW